MTCSQCSSSNRIPCPIFLNTNCIVYNGSTLPNLAVTVNERLNSILSKIDDKFSTPSVNGVTYVAFSGGSTGLSSTGGPITSSGTITLSGTLVPANGGTGKSSYTPYALLAGGTLSTSALQQISSLGTVGQLLTSNGAGSLPSWQDASGTGSVTSVSVSGTNGINVAGSPITTSGIISLSLGDITPSSVNGIIFTGSGTPNLFITGTSLISGNNTGDQTIILSGDVSGIGTGAFATTISNGVITEVKQLLSDNTTNNVSTSKHGYVPKATGDSTYYLDATGAWSVPAGGGGGGTSYDTLATWIKNINSTIPASSTRYSGIAADAGSPDSTLINRAFVFPNSGYVKSFFAIVAGTQPASGALDITLMKGASVAGIANTALTINIPLSTSAGAGLVVSDTTHSISVSAGDVGVVKEVNSASSTSLTIVGYSLIMTNQA